jgi:CheY-like chemotaxis protein
MNSFKHLSEVTGNLTVLYAEDEEISRAIVQSRLKTLFKHVILAENGLEGLEKYRQFKVDIVLTDNIMPLMNGLDLISEIRKTDIKTPIILITAFMDTDFLVKAINLGVTQFVAKPISFDNLAKAIEISVQRVIIENLSLKAKEQELELLRYREKYHSAQQERAFRKELNIIKNDLYLRKMEVVNRDGKLTVWFINLYYEPLDILSGDSYSIREISEGKVLLFLVDAMGKGLSASVTTILSTSFVNHLVDDAVDTGTFNFRDFIDSYTNFIKKELLDDEIVCASFVLIDFIHDVMDTAVFSMPAVLIQTRTDEIIRIKSNNLPIMKFLQDGVIDRHDISGALKILVNSDGLNESMGSGFLYEESLVEDFRSSGTKEDLIMRFRRKITKPDDDVTFLFLKRIDCVPKWTRKFVISSRLESLKSLSNEIEKILTEIDASEEFSITFINSLTEILMNSYEHGNLNIDSKIKNRLISAGGYEDYLTEAERAVDKMIAVDLSLIEEYGRAYLMLRGSDEGNGFDLSSLTRDLSEPELYNGRGITIAQSHMDELYYNMTGNEVTLIREIKRRK